MEYHEAFFMFLKSSDIRSINIHHTGEYISQIFVEYKIRFGIERCLRLIYKYEMPSSEIP